MIYTILLFAVLAGSPGDNSCWSAREKIKESFTADKFGVISCTYEWSEIDEGWVYYVEFPHKIEHKHAVEMARLLVLSDQAHVPTKSVLIIIFVGETTYSANVAEVRSCIRQAYRGDRERCLDVAVERLQ